MAPKAEYPLSLVIKAVDNATAPLRAINAKILAATAPARALANSFSALGKEAHLPAVKENLEKVGTALGNVRDAVGTLITRLAGIALAGAFGLYQITRSAVDAGDKLSEMSQRVGLGVDAYASLQFAAAQADIEQESFNSGIDKFNELLGQAKSRGGSLYDFLKKVSPVMAEQIRTVKGTEQGLALMTQALTKIKDPARRAALAQEAFGKSGKQFGQFLGQGSAAIQKQQLRYLELAGSQQKFADGASDADNAIRETETAFLGLRNAAATALFPALTKLSGGLTDFLAKHRDGIKLWAEKSGKAIEAWVDGGGIDRLTGSFDKFTTGVGSAIDKIGGLQNAAIAVGAVMASSTLVSVVQLTGAVLKLGGALFGLSLGETIASLGAFGLAAAPFIAAAGGIAAAGYQIYKNWADIKLLFKEFWDYNLGTVKIFAASISVIAKAVGDLAGTTLQGPLSILRGGISSVGESVSGFLHPDQARPSLAKAEVTVNFSNLPKGARISQEPNSSQPVDMNLGYSTVGP